MHITDLETPAVLIAVDVIERNLQSPGDYCQQHGLNLRPHTKTHKIPEFAHRQLRRGAVGISVANLGEAEAMADAHVSNILIAYPLVGETKLQRLLALASRVDVTIAVERATPICGSYRAQPGRIQAPEWFRGSRQRCPPGR